MKRAYKLSKTADHYAVHDSLVLRQDDEQKPWRVGKQTTLCVRRVIPTGGTEELQIEIRIDQKHKTRTTSTFCSFVLPPELADELAQACTTLVKPIAPYGLTRKGVA